jgi:hypothetical protein
MVFALAYMFSQGWNFYQDQLRTEKKIQKIQQLLKSKAQEKEDIR